MSRICCLHSWAWLIVLLISISNPVLWALAPHFRLSAVHFHLNVTFNSLWNWTPYYCPRKSAFHPEFLISVHGNPTGLDISVSFSFSPPIFHTNRSLHLTNPSLKMFHVSVQCSPFPQLAPWCKYQNFMPEIPDKELPHVWRNKCLTLVYSRLASFWTYSWREGDATTRLDSSLSPSLLIWILSNRF